MLKTHKIAMDANDIQRTYLAQCAGVARFAYNWALSRWSEQYEAHKVDESVPAPSQYSLRKELNAIKAKQFPWMLEVTKCAAQEAIIDLGKAFAGFFAKRARYPKYHKKGVCDSFRVSSGFFSISGKTLRLPCGKSASRKMKKHMAFRLREALRFSGSRIVSVTISREADKWYASVVCEVGESQTSAPLPESPHVVGVDVGVREYVTSDKNRYLMPRPLRNAQRRLRRAGKALSRKQKGSKNRSHSRERLARLHARVAHTRGDFLHKTTTAIVRDCDVAVIEDLNVKGMTRNRCLAKSIADASFGEFRREMAYKAAEKGRRLIVADRFYPSSKLCSACGAKAKRMPLSIRDWTCGECGTHHDRDVNAAINLREFGLSVLLGKPTVYADSSAVSACGEFCVSAGEDTFSPCPASVLCEAGTKQRTYR